jgi:trk system potassium uptake protein TrkH
MHWRAIIRFVAVVVLFLGVSMGAPLLVSIACEEAGTWALTVSALLTSAIGLGGFLLTREKETTHLSPRDGIAIVTLGWVMAGLFGALPYLFSGAISDFTNAYFESISGFTTTGASILNDIESLSNGILLWRSQTQWFGGMGIIVLSIAILPLLGVGGMQLYKAEVPSPVVDKLKPRISETAKSLWKLYILITVLEVILLLLGGLSTFDSVCHAFCTMPTGGFSTKNTSIAYFSSRYFDTIFIVFMLLAGTNFSLHYKLIQGDVKIFGKDPECRIFFALVVGFTLLVTWNIYGDVYASIGEAFRYAAFQVGSIITTTGFVTADYGKWPTLSQLILLLCMFLGAMAGSTGGAMKTMRIVLLVKHSYREIFRIIHPHAVTTVKLGGRPVPQDILGSIWGFFTLYLGLFILATLVMAALGLDLVSALASVAASIGNIGPGLGAVGPVENYFAIPAVGKWLLIFCMLIGRLEIYTIMVLVTPEYWRK